MMGAKQGETNIRTKSLPRGSWTGVKDPIVLGGKLFTFFSYQYDLIL